MLKLMKAYNKICDCVKAPLKRFHNEEDAPTMVEYGLLVALIALVVIVSALFLGSEVSETFNTAGNSVQGVN